MEYTVEVYKLDKRTKEGERLIEKTDYSGWAKTDLITLHNTKYPSSKGFRYEIHETYVTKKSFMDSSKTFKERYDTPYYCSPSSETYWSM
jgi:hypothetical protein